tara:strand:+ start:362 stop:1177 length:816 start_codon:yes stop_codon:yes gene_type:complete
MTVNISNGNCLELMKKLDDKSIDLMICDLPFGELNSKWDIKIDMEEFWKEFKRIRKSKKTACLHFCSTKFGYTLIKSNESMFKMDMVWKKRNKTGGLQSRNRPMRNHEMIYFFYEEAPKYNRDKYHKRIAPNPASVIKEKEEITKLNNPCDGKISKLNSIGIDLNKHSAYANKPNFTPLLPTSVLEAESPEPVSMFESKKVFTGKRHHQTEKPLDILEFFLKYWSDEGDTVLDPTMGSGSTGVACKNLNRNFIGFELDEKIYKVAEDRLKK